MFLDIRYAVRVLRRQPLSTAAILLTLTLGIGATTTVFSVLYAVLWRPLPYPDPDRLVRVFEEYQGASLPRDATYLSNIVYHAWLDAGTTTLESIAAYEEREYTVAFPDEPSRVRGSACTPKLFSLLRARPALGRFFLDHEATERANLAVILSDRLWHERFGSTRDVVGRTLDIDGLPHTIVGVAPAELTFPDNDTLLWTPLVVPRPLDGSSQMPRVNVFLALGRVRGWATIHQAETEGTSIARRMGEMPLPVRVAFGGGGNVRIRVRPLADQMTARVKPALLLIACGMACVLAIVWCSAL